MTNDSLEIEGLKQKIVKAKDEGEAVWITIYGRILFR